MGASAKKLALGMYGLFILRDECQSSGRRRWMKWRRHGRKLTPKTNWKNWQDRHEGYLDPIKIFKSHWSRKNKDKKFQIVHAINFDLLFLVQSAKPCICVFVFYCFGMPIHFNANNFIHYFMLDLFFLSFFPLARASSTFLIFVGAAVVFSLVFVMFCCGRCCYCCCCCCCCLI